MPPWSAWWVGRDTIAAFAAQAVDVCAEARTVRTSANGQVALAYFALDDETGRFKAGAIDVLTFEGDRDQGHHRVHHCPEHFARFGLPAELARSSAAPEQPAHAAAAAISRVARRPHAESSCKSRSTTSSRGPMPAWP